MFAVLAVGIAASSLALRTFLAVCTTASLLSLLLAAVFLLSLFLAAVSFLLSLLLAAILLLSFFVAAFFLSLGLVVRLCAHRCSGAQESHDHHGTYNYFLHI